jgi:hypothetical protein
MIFEKKLSCWFVINGFDFVLLFLTGVLLFIDNKYVRCLKYM